jgi:hypothetical protein
MSKIKEIYNSIPKPVKIGFVVLVAVALFVTILVNGVPVFNVNS